MAVLSIDGICRRNQGFLRDCDAISMWLLRLAYLIEMKPVGEPVVQPYSHWEGSAPSAVLFIEESAIMVHCYPEENYIEITLHSCKAIPDVEKVKRVICEELDLDVRYVLHEPARNWRERVLTPHLAGAPSEA